MSNKLHVTGSLNIKLYDATGRIKDERNEKNTIVATGLVHIARRLLLSDGLPSAMRYMGLGTSSNVTNSTTFSALGTEITTSTRPECTITYDEILPKITFVGNFAAATYTNSAITEAGIFNSIVVGSPTIMLCRVVFSPINKTEADTLGISWTITIS